jgi:uncharacterized protein YggU (UPF0235/DUF167 family)
LANRQEGVTMMVKVRPTSRGPGVGGVKDSARGPRLKIDVAAPAGDGKANQAVCAMLARAPYRPRASVRIVGGGSNSEKLLAVAGASASLVELSRAL